MAGIHLSLGALVFSNLFICCYFYTKDTLPDIKDEKFIDECVRTHNNFRSNVKPSASNMKRMSWDTILAESSQMLARKCEFQHSKELLQPHKIHHVFSDIGENIWAGSVAVFTPTAAITAWHDEFKNYEYATKKCSKQCGHYTQIVWANSYKVGCAAHYCPELKNHTATDVVFFACDYGPAGNLPTQPYKSGTPCSDCAGLPCRDNLCEIESSCAQYYMNPFLLLMTSVVLLFSSIIPEWEQ